MISNYDFSGALVEIKAGLRMRRAGWNGASMFVFLVPGSTFKVNRQPLLSILGEGTEVVYQPHIDIKLADGTIGMWTPSSADLMADDWEIA